MFFWEAIVSWRVEVWVERGPCEGPCRATYTDGDQDGRRHCRLSIHEMGRILEDQFPKLADVMDPFLALAIMK